MSRRYGSGHTPRHQIRIPDDLWQLVQSEAEREDVNDSEIVRKALRAYFKTDTVQPSRANPERGTQ